jgi:translocator protein
MVGRYFPEVNRFPNLIKLLLAIFICQAAGLIGTFFTVSSIQNWYILLNQPSFSPPNYLFGPVWITLYTLIGISFYLIWIKGVRRKEVKKALTLFLVHLLFNASWSIVFFGMHQILLALINIIILWIFIAVLVVRFSKIDKRAGLLLLPYLAWVSFATALNYSIWLLNK